MSNLFYLNRSLLTLLVMVCCLSLAAQTQFKTLNYLYSISGSKTVAGQQGYGYWETMHNVSGKYPAMWGEDLSFVISFGGANMADDRMKMAAAALAKWNQGAIVNIMYHACPPTMSEPCTFDNVKSRLNDTQWNDLVTNGTSLNNAWKARLDAIAPSLQYLKDNGVEVLFRPFHEMNHPSVFWWANRPGANGSSKLFQITHDYLMNTKGLTNLIWVWNLQDFNTLSSDVNNYDPGSSYYDMFTLDNYNSDGQGYSTTKYNTMVNKAGSKPIALGECDVLPSTSLLASQPRWTYFLAWRELTQQKNSNATISTVYNASNVSTLDEMPGWANTCNTVTLPGTVQTETYCSGSGVSTETTTDTGGGRNLSSIETNDWAAYRVNVPTTGSYIVQYRVAALNAGSSLRLEQLGGGTVFGTIAVPQTSGWQNWTTISQTIQLNAGVQDIALVGAVGGFNVNWMTINSASGSSNIAYNKPVSVTSIQGTGFEGSKAVDANGTTRWASATANNQNFVVDLGARYNINRIKITWEAAYAKDYQIQVSNDNATWTTIKEFWGKASSAADDYTGLNSTARWLKVYCINRATTYGFSIFEFEAYGTYVGARTATPEAQIETEDSATLYPNPTDDKVTIRIPSQFRNGTISLHSLEGKAIVTESIKEQQHVFNLSNLPSGLYIVHLRNNTNRLNLKVLKK